MGQRLERQGLQRVAGQDCGGFVPGLMDRWHAPAQVVVIHGRQVVMDQRIGVQAFDGGGGAVGLDFRHPKEPRPFDDQKCPEAFAAIKHPIAHGVAQPRLAVRRQDGVQAAFASARRFGQRRVKGGWHIRQHVRISRPVWLLLPCRRIPR